MLVDLHVHTHLSSDSRVAPESYLEAATRSERGLKAVCFTEHRLFPTDPELDQRYAALAQQFGILIFKGIEADTNLGHLLLFGVSPAIAKHFDLTDRMLNSQRLIEALYNEGGVAIPAHPFRDSGFGARLPELCARLGAALPAIEAINGQNSERENELAVEAAAKHGLVAVGGSDAHFATPHWFLTCATEFERDFESVEAMCAELRAGRARPARFNGS